MDVSICSGKGARESEIGIVPYGIKIKIWTIGKMGCDLLIRIH